MFLSGKVVYVQGYEPQILKELVYHFEEDDIIVGSKNVPEIWYYMENKKHRYFPDIYIKSINTIIEVKSKWTLFEQTKEGQENQTIMEINNHKRTACIEQGYNFIFAVI